MDWAHFEIHGLEATERVFHQAEVFVTPHELGGGEVLGGEFGADHVKPLDGGFAGDVFAASI